MSFQPVIAGAGLVGWNFLERTGQRQQEIYEQTGLVAREADYAREKLGDISSADDLVNDRTLLRIALGAYGLEDDLDNKFFIKRVLEDGTENSDALSNQLADKRYLAFSEAMGLEIGATGSGFSTDKIEEIIDLYQTRSFEKAVGDVDADLRLAMSIERDLGEVATKSGSNDAKWFTIMGTASLRAVFETALVLPDSFGTLDVDQQLEIFKERAESMLGTSEIADFATTESQENLRNRFLLNAQVQQISSQSPGATALSLLQASQF